MQLSLFTILCKNSTISEQLQHHRQEQTKEIMEIGATSEYPATHLHVIE